MEAKFTYEQIKEYVREHYNYTVQTCVIARVKREMGYDMRNAPNSGTSKNPKMPTERDRKAIREAIEYLESHK